MDRMLVAHRDGRLIRSVDLSGRSTVTIGRSPRCTLTLDTPSVSRRHALAVEHAGRWMIIDTGSRGGLVTSAGRSRCAALSSSDWLRVGPAFLWLDEPDEPDAPTSGRSNPVSAAARPGPDSSPSCAARGAAAGQDASATMVDWTGDPIALPMLDSEPALAPRLVVRDLTCAPILRRRLDECHKLTVGRSSGCDVVLPDPSVSRLHAVLYREGKQWCVADAGSSGGTRVDGRLARRRRLASGMMVRIGGFLLGVEAASSAGTGAGPGGSPGGSAGDSAGASGVDLYRRAG